MHPQASEAVFQHDDSLRELFVLAAMPFFESLNETKWANAFAALDLARRGSQPPLDNKDLMTLAIVAARGLMRTETTGQRLHRLFKAEYAKWPTETARGLVDHAMKEPKKLQEAGDYALLHVCLSGASLIVDREDVVSEAAADSFQTFALSDFAANLPYIQPENQGRQNDMAMMMRSLITHQPKWGWPMLSPFFDLAAKKLAGADGKIGKTGYTNHGAGWRILTFLKDSLPESVSKPFVPTTTAMGLVNDPFFAEPCARKEATSLLHKMLRTGAICEPKA